MRNHPFVVIWILLVIASQGWLYFNGTNGKPFSPSVAFSNSKQPGSPHVYVLQPGNSAIEDSTFWTKTGFPVTHIQTRNYSAAYPDSGFLPLAHAFARDFNTASRKHVVALGSAAPAALQWAGQDSTVKSLALIGASVLEEYVWLGDIRFNNAVYIALQSLTEAAGLLVPHFGLLPVADWSAHLKRLRSAQPETYRDLVSAVQIPVLLVHNRHDVMAPYSGAVALHQLFPESRLLTLDAGTTSFIHNGYDALTTDSLTRFLNEVEAGTAVFEKKESTELPEFKPYGLGLVLIFAAIILATFVTEDVTCFLAGVLAASGTISFGFAVAACVSGLVIGDFGLYLLGRLGRKVLYKAPFKYFIPEEQLHKGGDWVRRHGARVIFISRFTPGMRTITYVSAGILKAPALSFLGYFLAASLLWTPLLVGLSMIVGLQLIPYFMYLEQNWYWLLPGVWFFLWLIRSWLVPLFTWKGRRLLLSRIRRMYMWEFWPAWLYNIPTAINGLVQGLRHGRLSVVSATNPGIPHSGFVGESKVQILSAISDTSAVARFSCIPHKLPVEQQMNLFDAFMSENGYSFPIVLKPDVGQRGAGVTIIRSKEQARTFFDTAAEDSIVQEYIPGAEFGVFYIRKPWEPDGFIYSITEKQFTSVTGDGVSNLETLILRDNRTVCLAKGMLKKFEDRLEEVIPAGEKCYLTEIGNHFRGTLFLNGERLITPELTARIDAIAKSFPGFYYGRFDIRCPDASALAQGRDLKVIELNGITSEPTHIYHPGYPLLLGYRYLLGGWSQAFSIGAWNAKNGAKVTSMSELMSYYFHFLKTPAR